VHSGHGVKGEIMGDQLRSGSFDSPSEVREFPNGKAELVVLGDTTVGRFSFQPGWKWSDSVKPAVGTDSCQNHHLGVVTSGRLHVVADDGSEADVGAGDAYEILPGHDAWVVGDEPFVGYEFRSAAQYAKPQ
jgi:hypothetical protein